jgi:hypothetical protein
MRPAAHGAGPIHDAHQVQALQHRGHKGQGTAEVDARLRVQPGERSGQVVEGSRVLEAVTTSQVCHNTMADLALSIPVSLHDVDVLVDAACLADLLDPDEHFPYIITQQTT